MAEFLLVPGANHGGWWYAPLVEALEQAGHTATAVTLTGLDPDLPPAPEATLASHVAEVVARLEAAPEPVVLVGHSYGGSVIAQAADHAPGAVRALVFVDAFVPSDGDSVWSMVKDWEREWFVDGAGETGLLVARCRSLTTARCRSPSARCCSGPGSPARGSTSAPASTWPRAIPSGSSSRRSSRPRPASGATGPGASWNSP